jgi:SAM-dependent methyltransferase
MTSYEPVRLEDVHPCLDDRVTTTPFDPHYLYQSVWALHSIADRRPPTHVDIGSDIRFVTAATALTEVIFVDLRPLRADVSNLTCAEGSILALPFPDRSLASLSCLHVVEHIGLGRYGDPLDPAGTVDACRELQRVLAPGAILLLSLPVGRRRTAFNAHRIHLATEVLGFFAELALRTFALVDDQGNLRRDARVEEGDDLEYGCGLYELERPGRTS